MKKINRSLVTATTAALLLATPLLAAPNYVPNSLKYSDTGIANAQGRSGSATVTARALLNRDGSTDLDVTTGDFDGAAPSGTLKHVQIKLGTTSRNYTMDSSTFALHLAERLVRHTPLQVQSNVYGADDHRTGVVTVDEIVKLRPDLAPGELNVPQQALVNLPVMISAVIEERNGDTGARANCVLYANGVEADRANGIWVDAGDSVVCSFQHAFSTTGDQQLEVRLDSVVPGDWDTSNNTLAGTVKIVDGGATPIPEWIVNANDRTWTRWSKMIDPGYYEDETTESGFAVGLHFYGYVKQADLDYDTVSIGYREVSGGTTFADSPSLTFETEGPTFYGKCKQFWEQGVRAIICTPALPKNFPYDEGPTDLISIQASRFATDITYHSAGSQWRRDWETGEEYLYTWNNGFHQVEGMQAHYGDTLELDVTLRDGANRTFAARPNLQLESYEQHHDVPYVCWGAYCNGSSYHLTGKRGTQSFNW